MRSKLLTSVGVFVALVGLGGCALGGGEAATDTTLGTLGSPSVFRTIPPTTTTLSETIASDGGALGSGELTYEIVSGDYPIKISTAFGCESWDIIASFNEINPDNFPFPGTVINIPPECAGEPVAPGSDTSVTPTETSDAPATTGADGEATYVIQAGDYPFGVAANFDCTWAEIAAANGLASDGSEFPFPGETIKIPGACGT
jgi:LysM repeat protein